MGEINYLNDPNFLNLLAGIGARLDPEGVAGALGGATQQLVQSRAAQRAVEQQDTQRQTTNLLSAAALYPEGSPQRNEYLSAAINMLGGMSPQGRRGVTSTKIKPDGSVDLNVDLQDALPPTGGETTGSTASGTGTSVASPQASTGVRPQRLNLDSIVPFY